MAQISLASLLVQQTKDKIYDFALGVANAIGLPVSSWQAGDPTRSYYHVLSEKLARWEPIIVGFISAGFLDAAAEVASRTGNDVWLRVCAEQFYGVTVPEPTAATTQVVLTNPGGGVFEGIQPNSISFRNTTSGKTYHNTTGGNLFAGPGTTLTIGVEADEVGSDSSAAVGEIDEIITGDLAISGVTCTNPVAAIGRDRPAPGLIVQQCRNRLGRPSPDGPREIYLDTALDPEVTGTSVPTDGRVYSESEFGDVTIYLRSATGAVPEPDRLLVEAAIVKWATPLCITPTVLSAVPVVIAVAYQLWIYKRANLTAEQIEELVEEALERMFSERKIGGDVIPPAGGMLYGSLIQTTIQRVSPEIFRVEVSQPAGDTPINLDEVATLGAVTGTVHVEVDP